MSKETKIAITVILATVLAVILYIGPDEIKNSKNYLDVTFEYNGNMVTVRQENVTAPFIGTVKVLQITVRNNDCFIFARVSAVEKNPWEQNFTIIDRSNCDPNLPIYNYTWKDFAFFRDMAHTFRKARETVDQPLTPELEAEILEAPNDPNP